MDMLQERIRKFKCPIVLDLALEQQHIPAAFASDNALEGMVSYCSALLAAFVAIFRAGLFRGTIMMATAPAAAPKPMVIASAFTPIFITPFIASMP